MTTACAPIPFPSVCFLASLLLSQPNTPSSSLVTQRLKQGSHSRRHGHALCSPFFSRDRRAFAERGESRAEFLQLGRAKISGRVCVFRREEVGGGYVPLISMRVCAQKITMLPRPPKTDTSFVRTVPSTRRGGSPTVGSGADGGGCRATGVDRQGEMEAARRARGRYVACLSLAAGR